MNSYLRIIISVLLCVLVGFLSSFSTRSSVTTWYPTLTKPFFNPPNEIFGPVWTLLYLMMGVAAGLVWNKIETQKELVKKALLFFAIQLALNALWSILFFGLQNPFLAAFEIILLLLMIYETYYKFKKVNVFAANLLIPYLFWVSFAAILNFSIAWLNR